MAHVPLAHEAVTASQAAQYRLQTPLCAVAAAASASYFASSTLLMAAFGQPQQAIVPTTTAMQSLSVWQLVVIAGDGEDAAVPGAARGKDREEGGGNNEAVERGHALPRSNMRAAVDVPEWVNVAVAAPRFARFADRPAGHPPAPAAASPCGR